MRDQYVHHIINETRATVLLKERGSGNSESAFGEEGQQPLHLYLSSNNPKSIESAKLLAKNLLDTISIKFHAFRDFVTIHRIELHILGSCHQSLAIHPGITTTLLQGTLSQSIGLSCRAFSTKHGLLSPAFVI
ncbi:protein RIK-like [Camellia sinensis]|uniref:protein RIK-like n=1 Tax=Camellia sinensis TaxID=4442 RepID=UPI001035B18A|nr:protein RIK-like [Camellia sinensis]